MGTVPTWARSLEKGMATHSSILFNPGESPWTKEPGGLQAIGLQTVGHEWSNLACIQVCHSFPSKEQVSFNFLASITKITADGDCSHKIKRRLLLGRKVMTNLDSIFKSRDITLPTKVRLVKAMVFPVVMHGCESWTMKKAEHWRTDAFELWYWRRLLRVPWIASRSNWSILKKSLLGVHWKDWCWSWNSSILATWCKELTHLKRP